MKILWAVALISIFRCTSAEVCSVGCENEFLNSCLPYHCGLETANPFAQCRSELDSQVGSIAVFCSGESGCTDTAAMAAKESNPCSSGAPVVAPVVAPVAAPTTDGDCREAGTSTDGTHIRIIGDSLLFGQGVQTSMATVLNTRVVNCAVWGASLTAIASQTACSMAVGCSKWSIVSGGRNGPGSLFSSTLEGMTSLVDRERAAGHRVIIFLYAPDAASYEDPDSQVNRFQNEYFSLVDDVNVLIYDPRTDLRFDYGNSSSRKYRGDDDSHPSELCRQVMGTEVANIILAASIDAPVAAPTDAPVVAPTTVACPGPFSGYDDCESKITYVMDVRPDTWLDKRDLARERCAIQNFYSESVNGAFCPAPAVDTTDEE